MAVITALNYLFTVSQESIVDWVYTASFNLVKVSYSSLNRATLTYPMEVD